MINRESLVPIGQFKKPHGRRGEIACSFTEGVAGQARNDADRNAMGGSTCHLLNLTGDCPFLICEMDGIFVPFRVENSRFISNTTAYVQLKNINTDQEARKLSYKEVYYPKNNIEETIEDDSFSWEDFIGFTLTDKRLGTVGLITDVDATTINTLFVVEKGDEVILIPAVEAFIIRVDDNQEELIVDLPEGLVE